MSEFLSDNELFYLQAVSNLSYCNPFLPERIGYEKQILGDAYSDKGEVWSAGLDVSAVSPNINEIKESVDKMVEVLYERLKSGVKASAAEAALYEDLINYFIYYRYIDNFIADASGSIYQEGKGVRKYPYFKDFCGDIDKYLNSVLKRKRYDIDEMTHLFACLCQVARAFYYIFRFILGESLPIAKLRASAWQSVFTCDMRRYRRCLYKSMVDVPVLVTGPSGSGKELVSRAIGYSRYIPFNPKNMTFAAEWNDTFYALNLSALSPTLIESEIFGHSKGSFTGATDDRQGWLESAGDYGAVFLDEIGEINGDIQVKLLRVIESRIFNRLGETVNRKFSGKLIAATNRDMAKEIEDGSFRKDLYYRLCADIVETPSLNERFVDCPSELDTLVMLLSIKIIGQEEGPELASQVIKWVKKNLKEYTWPGNVRELEQCIRNVMIRGCYQPSKMTPQYTGLAGLIDETDMTADELLAHYCQQIYRKYGSYEAAGRVLNVDRRTVKARIESLN